ncbi:ATP-binding cassette domain-containing protein [Streptomyces sp. NPDC056653]|uniref:ABC transporter permease subunit n=1 Tax=Streptomyces sp. NPDC056653 TaxID=3345894 RepID=UPI0036CB9ED2
MDQVALFAILGLGAGAAYALIAQGLILVHRASGVVNFAQSAVAMITACFYVWLTDHGLSTVSAAIVAVLAAGVLGAVIQRLVMRPLVRAPLLAKLVATLGIVLLLQAGAGMLFGYDAQSVPSLLPTSTVHLFGIDMGRDRIILCAIALVLAAALSWFAHRTTLGSLFRAASDSEEGIAILGYSQNTVALTTWVVGSMLAGFAGIMVTPITSLNATTTILLIIPALAVTLLAGFRSFWTATIAGLVLGIALSEIAGYWNIASPSIDGMQQAVPFLLIIAVMVVRGRVIPGRATITLGRPPLAPPARAHPVVLAAVVVAVVAMTSVVSNSYQTAISVGLISAIIALSLVVLTGYVGQISLAQMTFAGLGAWFCSQFAAGMGIPFPFPVILAGLATGVCGLLLGLPALRVRGVSLAVVTLGAAVAVSSLIFGDAKLTGGLSGIHVPSPEIFRYSLDGITHPFRYTMTVLVVLILCVAGVAWLRRSRLGLMMLAVRDNERAAAAEAVNTVRTKLIAFGIASFLAGIAGALFGYLYGHLSFDSFAPLASVTFVTTAYIGGIGSIAGAVVAGLLSAGGPLFALFSSSASVDRYQALIAGVGVVLTAVLNPDGIAPEFNRNYKAVLARWRLGRQAGTPGSDAGLAPAADQVTTGDSGRAGLSVAERVAQRRRGGDSVRRNGPPLLEARDIRVTFGSVRAVDGVDLTVRPGSLIGLIGPNGAGKTTLIDALCGFVPSTGTVRFGDESVEDRPPHARARMGLRRTFQNTELFEDLTIRENLVVPAHAHGEAGEASQFSVGELLRLVGLEGKSDCYPRELSNGETKLAGLARALRGRPRLLLLDEPAAGLDSAESQELGLRLLSLLDLGISMVLVDHDLELVMGICDEVVVLDRGGLLASGPPDAVRCDPAVRTAYIGVTDDGAELLSSGEPEATRS